MVMPNGEVCFLDFGLMGSILDRDIEMFGKLFMAVKAKDIKAIIKVLQQMSEITTISDMRSLEYALNEFVEIYSVNSVHENEMSTILMELKDVVVEHGLKVPPHFFLLARSMVTIEGVIHHLDPDLDLLELARPYLIDVIKRKINPLKFGKKFLSGLIDLASYMEEFPQDLKNAIRKINNGKVKVDLTHKGIDPMVHTINRVTKQIVTSLLAAGLLVGAIILIVNKVEPFYHGVSVYGIIGVIIAGILGYGMWRDVRKGDHDDWKGWEE